MLSKQACSETSFERKVHPRCNIYMFPGSLGDSGPERWLTSTSTPSTNTNTKHSLSDRSHCNGLGRDRHRSFLASLSLWGAVWERSPKFAEGQGGKRKAVCGTSPPSLLCRTSTQAPGRMVFCVSRGECSAALPPVFENSFVGTRPHSSVQGLSFPAFKVPWQDRAMQHTPHRPRRLKYFPPGALQLQFADRRMLCSPPQVQSPSITVCPHYPLACLRPPPHNPPPMDITTLWSTSMSFFLFFFLFCSLPPPSPPGPPAPSPPTTVGLLSVLACLYFAWKRGTVWLHSYVEPNEQNGLCLLVQWLWRGCSRRQRASDTELARGTRQGDSGLYGICSSVGPKHVGQGFSFHLRKLSQEQRAGEWQSQWAIVQ